MRKLLFILLIFSFTHSYGQKKNSISPIEKKVDSLILLVKALQLEQNDSTFIKVDKLDEIFKKAEQSWGEKLLPALIAFVTALITVAISSFVAYSVGKRNAETQLKNAAAQIEAQIAIAGDQMQISRTQIEQNTLNTLAQIRANNISKARIEWIQELRILLGSYFAKISELMTIISEIKDAQKRKNDNDKVKYYEIFYQQLHKLSEQSNHILLYLNPSNKTHETLIMSMREYYFVLNLKVDDINVDLVSLNKKVIDDSRIVIKEAWEKAKTDATI